MCYCSGQNTWENSRSQFTAETRAVLYCLSVLADFVIPIKIADTVLITAARDCYRVKKIPIENRR
jgi:hypothetical protein